MDDVWNYRFGLGAELVAFSVGEIGMAASHESLSFIVLWQMTIRTPQKIQTNNQVFFHHVVQPCFFSTPVQPKPTMTFPPHGKNEAGHAPMQ